MDQGGGYGDVILPGGLMDGSYPFGDEFTPRPNVTPQRDRWTCYEIMVQCNTTGEHDGRVGLWIDGALVADHPHPRFRTVESLKARFVTLGTVRLTADRHTCILSAMTRRIQRQRLGQGR